MNRRRLVNRIVAGLKARRPPQTMADIPYAVRKVAKDYIDQVELIEYWGEDWEESKWHRADLERSRLHELFMDALRKVGVTWAGRHDAQQMAEDIVKRKWRGRARPIAPKLHRLIEKAERLGWYQLEGTGVTGRLASLYPTPWANPRGVNLVVRDSGVWEVRRGPDRHESGRGSPPTVAEAKRAVNA